MVRLYSEPSSFFFNDTATTEIYTLSLHDALPICHAARTHDTLAAGVASHAHGAGIGVHQTDRKSTRLNSSHQIISYAVFCLKKKRKIYDPERRIRAANISLNMLRADRT